MAVFAVVERVAVHSVGRPFTLELEDHQAAVVTRSKEVQLRVGSDDPEAIVLPPESVHRCATLHVPDSDGAVLRIAAERTT